MEKIGVEIRIGECGCCALSSVDNCITQLRLNDIHKMLETGV